MLPLGMMAAGRASPSLNRTPESAWNVAGFLERYSDAFSASTRFPDTVALGGGGYVLPGASISVVEFVVEYDTREGSGVAERLEIGGERGLCSAAGGVGTR